MYNFLILPATIIMQEVCISLANIYTCFFHYDPD